MTGTLNVTTPTDREIVITRTFDASRELVWEAMTHPEKLRRWLFGPPGWEMTICENELEVGKQFRWVWRGSDGFEMCMTGTNQEIVPPERVVRTERFETGCDAQAGEQRATLVLAESVGKTKLTLTIEYPSKEARDASLASGMERGLSAGYDRLDEMLTSIQK